ncbi:hypothetical protein HAX54_012209 [Datura stramonium]|uniref:Uncharacterized protein n=1 Tax=Datura stramonium TaxID=4076 RepID=A0ABS8TJD7_DATST|nr:hypothetical protein [Datura stramonium]
MLGHASREILPPGPPLSGIDMIFLDESMAAPHTASGPIDDLLGDLGEDYEVEYSEDGGDGTGASDEVEAHDDVEE